MLLLDEPAAGLNRKEAEALITLVRDTAGDAAVLLVEHDQHVVAMADRVVVLHLGRVLAPVGRETRCAGPTWWPRLLEWRNLPQRVQDR